MRARTYVILLAVAGAALWAADGRADVTIKGQVKYWDEFSKSYKPARHVFVEVEGWWWMADPHVETDDNGNYSATVRNPWSGDFDGVDIEAYAETEGVLQVYNWTLAAFPYHIISTARDGVKADSTVTIDLRFGKPAGEPGQPSLNVDEAPYRGEVDTAKAFVAHQQMYAHYSRLRQMGWPAAAFPEQEVIAPAMNPFADTSYYDHASNYLNLVTANDKWATGPWNLYPTAAATGMPSLPKFLHTCRHEYSHAIHDEITLIAPFGLNLPWDHSPYKETNRWVAYTEGFADFLALVTFMAEDPNQTQYWESSRPLPGAAAFPVLTGDHWAMEGEVTGLLWDIYDPPGFEPVRNPSTTAANGGAAVPADLQRKQVFLDALHDSGAKKIRQIVSGTMVFPSWTGTVETIRQFLERYRDAHPNELHGLKAIAFNRGITDPMPAENAACFQGPVSLTRRGGTVTLAATVREPDAEDRPFLRVVAYHERPAGSVKVCGTIMPGSGGWQGDCKAISGSFSVPAGFQPGDPLWIEVTDDMLPRVYRFGVPVKDDAMVVVGTILPVVLPEQPKISADLKAELEGRLRPTIQRADERHPELKRWQGEFEPVHRTAEDFEGAIGPLWQFVGNAAVKAEASGHVLAMDGLSTGAWHVGALGDFALRFRYRHGSGVGDLLLTPKLPQPPAAFYHLAITATGMQLIREQGGVPQVLGGCRLALGGGWHQIEVRQGGGRFDIEVDGAAVLSAADAAPIAADVIGFGSAKGAGFAYDDIVLERRSAADVQMVKRIADLLREARKLLRADNVRRRLLARQAATINRLAQGNPQLRLPAVRRQEVIFQRQRLADAATAAAADAARAATLAGLLAEAVAAYQLDDRPELANSRTGVAMLCSQTQQALGAVAKDAKLEPALRQQQQLMDALQARIAVP
jgi:hypothetical protein